MKKKNRLLRISFLIAFLAFFGLGQNAWAQKYWKSAVATGDWNLSTNWSATSHGDVDDGGVPGAGDAAIIPAGVTVTIPAGINAVAASITIDGSGSLLMAGAAPTLTISAAGDLIITGAGTFDVSAATGAAHVVIPGDLANSATGTVVLTGAGSANITIGGTITNAGGTFTTDNTTNLILNGTVACTLPADIAALNSLTISGGATVLLGADATIGNAGPSITISNGYLDLNGNNITLGNVGAIISETYPYRIINSGAYGAYVVTASTAVADVVNTGIGVDITGSGNYTVYRYPQTGSLIRAYRIVGSDPTAATFQFAAAESSVSLASVVALSSADINVPSPTNYGTPTATVSGALSSISYTFSPAPSNEYFFLMGNPSLSGSFKTFTGSVGTDWTNPVNWNPIGVPSATDSVVIPSGKTVVVDNNGGCKSMTIVDATASVAAGRTLDLDGHLTLLGTSSFTPANATNSIVTFTGGTTQNIIKSDDSYLEFGQLVVNHASSAVVTSADLTIRNVLTTTLGTFTANGGTVTFNLASGAVVAWNAAGGAITLNDVLINTASAAAAVIPTTSITVKGNFTKVGATHGLTPSAGTITFSNTDPVGKNIQLSGGASSFFNLAVASGSKVLTSSTFSITGTGTGAINILGTGSFIAQAGTITMAGAAGSIDVASAGTLKFNNLTVSAAAVTTSNFTINGNLTTGAAFTASGGSNITFENNISKTLTFTTAPTFFRITVANGSTVVTTATNFTISGVEAAAANAGITIEGTGSFTQDVGGVTTFAGNAVTYPKTIVVSSTGTLKFGDIVVSDVANNNVTTSSNFIIQGNGPNVIAIGSATAGQGTFTATTPSTITLKSAGAIQNVIAKINDLVFHNLLIDNVAITLAATEAFVITGDLTINGASGNFTSIADGLVKFSGSVAQAVNGSSTNTPTFGNMIVDKGSSPFDATETVSLSLNTIIANGGALTLTNGILNLNNKTLTIGGTVTRTNGLINGATGTYVIAAGHTTTILSDALFTINNEPTLFNLTVGNAEAIDGTLTVKGKLYLNGADLTYTGQSLVLHGDLQQAAGADQLVHGDTGSLTLTGTGTVIGGLSNAFFAASTIDNFTLNRSETLGGALTFTATAATFTINTSVNNLDISTYTLTLDDATVLNLVSGGIKADAGTVVLGTHASQTTIPANLFVGDVVKNLTIGDATTLGSDLTINGTLAGAYEVITNQNTLTLGPSAVHPFTKTIHVVGNLRRTVTNSATVFPIGTGSGDATGFAPISLKFETAGSSQIVKVSTNMINPTLGRAGDPTRAINALWTITPEGTAPSDDINIEFGWGSSFANVVLTAANALPAKWNTSSWLDYRAAYGTSTMVDLIDQVGPPALTYAPTNGFAPTTTFAIPASALAGEWTVFVATANNNDAKNAAIAANLPKIGIVNVNPNPVDEGFPFALTIQLQDQYGNPMAAPEALTITMDNVLGVATAPFPPVTIPVGQSSVIVPGFSYPTASTGNQLKATLTTPTTITINSVATSVLPGISPVINVLDAAPAEQASGITLTGATYTSVAMAFTLTAPGEAIVLAKAGSPITAEEFPVDGATYLASANFGQGSAIGEAVVVYKGLAAGTPVTINGLAPGTRYYFRAFAFAGSNGNEKYAKFSAANNPKSEETESQAEFNDDIVYGSNDTRLTAKPIGTNSPIKATLSSASDEDWFSFMVTSSTPNVRAQIYTLPGNYTLEVYDMDGNRIRRSTLNSRANEAAVINGLPSGTYTVRIFSQDGSYRTQLGEEYFLKVSTFGSEIYAVTP